MVPKCDLQYKIFNNSFIFNYVYDVYPCMRALMPEEAGT